MNKMTFAAIAVAAILLIAGAYVVMSMGNTPGKDGTDGGDSNQPDAVDSDAKTLAVAFPVEISANDRKMALSMTYPGKGESGYTYNYSEPYQFGLTASPASGYTGNVLIKMFAERSGEIGRLDLSVKDFQGKDVNWTLEKKTGAQALYNVISGDIASWKTNGSTSVRSFEVSFTATGNYTLIIQAFDLDTGKPISDPVTATPLYVPVKGQLDITALFHGEKYETSNGTYYRILIKTVNDWNIRYSVDPANFHLYDGNDWVQANTTATSFQTQSLAVGQTTQFFVYFDLADDDLTLEDRLKFSLKYEDPASGDMNIVLPTPQSN